MGLIANTTEEVIFNRPVPSDVDYSKARKPVFLDRVKTTHVIEPFYIQIINKNHHFSGYIEYSEPCEWSLKEAEKYIGNIGKQIPDAVKVIGRNENFNSNTVYYVIGYKRLKEGQIFRSRNEEPTYFVHYKTHKVAVLMNKMNNKIEALITDLIYLDK